VIGNNVKTVVGVCDESDVTGSLLRNLKKPGTKILTAGKFWEIKEKERKSVAKASRKCIRLTLVVAFVDACFQILFLLSPVASSGMSQS
jgi:hypothetical protein